MRFVTRRDPAGERLAVLDGDDVYDVPGGMRLVDLLGDPDALRRAGDAARRAGAVGTLDEIDLAAPLLPPTIRDFSVFVAHNEGLMMRMGGKIGPEFWESPVFYFSCPWAVTGPFDDVPIPPGSELFDFELELGAVIGEAGYNLAPEDAERHIAGYVILNDWTARDVQRVEMPRHFGPVKSKDTATTLGSVFVTADELESRRSRGSFDIRGQIFINDELFGEDRFDNMAWGFPELVSYASRGTWVRPGDVIGSGTCGRGCLAELWGREGDAAHAPLQVGDVVTMTIEELGSTRNRIVAGDPVHPITAVPEVRAGWDAPETGG